MLWLLSYKAIHKTDNNRCILQTDVTMQTNIQQTNKFTDNKQTKIYMQMQSHH